MLKNILEIGPVIAFFAAYYMTKNTHDNPFIFATYILIAASTIQLLLSWLIFKKIEKLHLIVFALLVFFGGLTIIFQDETFLKWKPTVVSWLFAAVLVISDRLFKKNLLEKFITLAMKNLPDIKIQMPAARWLRLNLYTAFFFVFSGCLNLWIAFQFDNDTWVNFKLIGIPLLNIVGIIGLLIFVSRHLNKKPLPDGALLEPGITAVDLKQPAKNDPQSDFNSDKTDS